MEVIFVIIVLVVIISIIYWAVSEARYRLERFKNRILGTEGRCVECRYCCIDNERKYSDTGYFCRLSKCDYITEETVMNCFEKPKITEDDLNELFTLGIWNDEGKRYIEETVLGKSMTFSELDEFLKKIPLEHPDYIDPNYFEKNQ